MSRSGAGGSTAAGLYVDVRALRGDFAVEATLAVADETVAIVGPNGAGKSTLLRCIAGLMPPTSGRITLHDRVLDDADVGIHEPPARRGIGVVFQEYLLFPHRSALDNVAYGLRAQGHRAGAARRRAHGLLDRVGLAAQAALRPAQLSGGQAQRVALARALAIDPATLLLDEPLAALDIDARQDIRRRLRAHLRDFRGPALVVTHDPVEAATLADRLVVLEDGRITQHGTIDDVTRRPRSAWAARLAGVNLYEGRAADGHVTLIGGGRITAAGVPDGDVFVAIPPRAVALFRELPAGTPRNVWAGRVDGFDSFGDRVRVHLAGSPAITAEITPAAAADLDLARGGAVHAAVKATEVTTYPR
ncbi:MAG: ABC transporter ATP-binding protein [Actinobacteria bacterium]|nr:ABC transporter ATP-binding protein [Actinomycetota bacterium]